MSFKDIIDKILETNTLGINTPSGLEREIGASVGAVRKYYNENKYPGLGTIKKIKARFGISDADWKAGNIGNSQDASGKDRFIGQAEDEPFIKDMWHTVKKDNAKFQQEIDRLWGLIDRLELPGDGVKSITAKDG